MEIVAINQISPDQVILFQWGWVVINATIAYTWLVMGILVASSILITRKLSAGPTMSRWQHLMEVIIITVRSEIRDIAKDSAGARVLVYPCLLGHLAQIYATPTVRITSDTTHGNYTFVPNSWSWFDGAMVFDAAHDELISTIRRDGADLFYIYKYKAPTGWRCGWETETNYVYQNN